MSADAALAAWQEMARANGVSNATPDGVDHLCRRLREANNSLGEENEKLRSALSDCSNHAAGFRCTSGACSTEFLLHVPEEVRLQIGARERDRDANKAALVRVEAERDALRAELSEAVQDIPIRGGETFGSAVQGVIAERDCGYEFLRRWQEFATQAMRRIGAVDEETFPDDTEARRVLLEIVDERTALMQLDTSWPLAEVLTKLCDAADHLLHAHDCDAHGWELVGSARDAGRAIVQRLIERRAS